MFSHFNSRYTATTLLIPISLFSLSLPIAEALSLSLCRSCQSLFFPLPIFFSLHCIALSRTKDSRVWNIGLNLGFIWIRATLKLHRSLYAAQSLSFPLHVFSLHCIAPSLGRRLIGFVGLFKYGFRLDLGLIKAPLVLGFCLGHLASIVSLIIWVISLWWNHQFLGKNWRVLSLTVCVDFFSK